MGNWLFGFQQAPAPPPQPTPPLRQPWRYLGKGVEMEWNQQMEDALRKKCLQCDLDLPKGQQVRILMMGATGSGKSSFINSLYAALTDEVQERTFTALPTNQSTTKRIFNPLLRIGGKIPYFRILDSPGILESNERFYEQFVQYALRGHLKENVEYKPPEIPTDKEHYVPRPGKLDSPCLVVFILKPSEMKGDDSVQRKLEIVKELASSNGIKLAVVVTKADLVSEDEQYPLKGKNVQYIFNSEAVLGGVRRACSYAGLSQNRIFPVTNYIEQTETCTEMNIVLLYTLTKLLDDAKYEADCRLCGQYDQKEEEY